MTPEQTSLIARIHALIADEPVVREVSMFGGRAVMVNEKMIVSAGKTGDLLVRVDADRHDELLEKSGARQAEMGTGREMGPGWIQVSAEAIADDKALATWLETAMDFNRKVTSTGR
ncbi:TfoX/Sxy family transcriptional regulator of competence genes [Brevibacterium epidermidis]|jgi:TfoX/Sxy family transcriptional regulator of competence genes|uniref:TfoX/Sxy family transcriptional regulator of competence genes n=1 Tax=Brevibacterium epidermidis TaxID=1698 RepID=A0ABV4EL47_BREEP